MNVKSSFLQQRSLIDIENSQNQYFYIKAGEKNKEIANKIIKMYDLNHSILDSIKPYFLTNELQIAIDKFFMEREFYLTKMLEKYLTFN